MSGRSRATASTACWAVWHSDVTSNPAAVSALRRPRRSVPRPAAITTRVVMAQSVPSVAPDSLAGDRQRPERIYPAVTVPVTVLWEGNNVNFSILGSVEAVADDHALLLGGPRQRALLARLLVDANRPVSVDRLASDLWDVPPHDVHGALQNQVSRLRKVLGDRLVT